jgi:hypothetical protein
MQTVPEVPDDSVSELQATLLEDVVEENIKREHFAIVNEVSDFPTDAPILSKSPNKFLDDSGLFLKVDFKCPFTLVGFPEVVRRG